MPVKAGLCPALGAGFRNFWALFSDDSLRKAQVLRKEDVPVVTGTPEGIRANVL